MRRRGVPILIEIGGRAAEVAFKLFRHGSQSFFVWRQVKGFWRCLAFEGIVIRLQRVQPAEDEFAKGAANRLVVVDHLPGLWIITHSLCELTEVRIAGECE